MYPIATMAQREGKECERLAVINEVNRDEPDDKHGTDETDVAAFGC